MHRDGTRQGRPGNELPRILELAQDAASGLTMQPAFRAKSDYLRKRGWGQGWLISIHCHWLPLMEELKKKRKPPPELKPEKERREKEISQAGRK